MPSKYDWASCIAGDLNDIERACWTYNLEVLAITTRHVLAEVSPQPLSRDPFDRLLLAQASAEGMRLVTLDRALGATLSGHPLVWGPTTP